MPAKKKIVVKKSAKPASKSAKPAAIGKIAKTAVHAKTTPATKKATKPSPKAAKPATPSKSGTKTKTAPPAKTAVKAKSAPPVPAKKGKIAEPKAAKKTTPAAPIALKEKTPAKKSAPAAKTEKPAVAKAEKPAAAAKPAPEPEAAAAEPAPAPAKPAKAAKVSKPAAPKGSGAAPALSKGFNAGPHLKPMARRPMEDTSGATIEVPKVVKSTPFSKRQRQRLLELRSMLLDSMESVADGSLRSRPEGSEASAFGQHMADAGSDAYDRDFALSLLSQEQDALYEINEALKRVDIGTYGICEMSGKPIPEIRLEALPFARFTVECQAQLEREGMGGRHRRPVRSLFGLEGESEGDSDGDDEEETETVDNKQE
ncbi:MAG: yocK [Verrucomicrobiaceae bacterium]|nr:yocK [Verrucomicrobiaceae bacterium]MDB6116429.1 yocK [Verrucomicrobiaceae bacterium]